LVFNWIIFFKGPEKRIQKNAMSSHPDCFNLVFLYKKFITVSFYSGKCKQKLIKQRVAILIMFHCWQGLGNNSPLLNNISAISNKGHHITYLFPANEF